MKKCFRIILAVMTLVALFTIGASAAEPVCSGHEGWTPIYNTKDKQPSDTSGVTFDTYGIKITQPGNYYLAENITCGRVNFDTPTANDTDNKQGSFAATLCLNGKTVVPEKTDNSNYHGIRVGYHHSLTLTNCSTSGGTVTGNGKSCRNLLLLPYATVEVYGHVHMDGNTTNTNSCAVQVNGKASFSMYGGSINGNSFTTSGSNNDGIAGVLVGLTGSSIKLIGGEICNNAITGATSDTYVASVISSGGGTVEISEDFKIENNVICGGEYSAGGLLIRDGDSETPSTVSSSGTISGNSGATYGGIAMFGVGTVTVSGGRITGNTAKQMSGGIYLAGGSLTVSGGEISANSATNEPVYDAQVAVNSYKDAGTATFTMSAGTISSAGGSENALMLYRGVAKISGGTINGITHAMGVGAPMTLTVSGGTFNGRLAMKELPHPGVGVEATCTISLGGGRFSDDTNAENLENWLAPGATMEEVVENGEQFYQVNRVFCDGSHSGFSILNDAESHSVFGIVYYTYKTNGKTISTSGSYYLKNDITGSVTADDGTTCAINVTADNVTLCLGGHSVKPSSNYVAIRCSGKNLKIVNCSTSNGTITGKTTCSVHVVAGGSVTAAENVHIDGATDLTTAPVVVDAGGSFTLSGGTISKNAVKATTTCAAGAICAAGDVALNYGTINGNNLTIATGGYGSGAVTMTDANLTMGEHATISANKTNSHGGAVALYGTSVLNMSGGTISDNSASESGGGVAIVDSDTKFSMSGGTLSGNKAGRWGGGVAARKGEFELSGGIIKDNDLGNGSYEYGNQITVGTYAGSVSGKFTMTGGTIQDTAAEVSDGLMTSTDVTVSAGVATITGGTIAAQVGVVGVPTGTATLNISGGIFKGDIINAVPLPTNTTDKDTTNDTEAQMEEKRKAATVNITGGEFHGALIETTHESRPGGITNTIVSGGKFIDFADDTQEVLTSFLDDTKGILSVMEISEGELVYEVCPGLVYNGAYMDFGSSLDLGLNLVAGVGDCTEDISGYTLSLSGGDADVKSEIVLKEIEGTKQLFVMAHGIAAKEMRDDITFTLKKDGEVWFTKTMSVYDAAKELGEGKDADYTAMLADMIYYGTQAQRRFGYNLRTLLSKPDLENTSYGKVWTESTLDVSDGQAGKVSLSLSLKEQIELNFYIRDPQARITNVKFANETIPTSDYTVVQATGTNDAYTMISFREIPVTRVKEAAQFTVTLRDGTTFDVIGGITDYVRLAQNDSAEGALVAALRNYVDSVYNVFSVVPETPAAARVSVEEL